ncbi:MAG: RdgB/HAM1 family non-canonical purine NTP pyrophosphatase [Deltaproteobacteria bacterium]|nr:RdgB/HAM1 family non-canonical purine NTP pyrophosphatase [Deltaproteobacteria bacterium]
MRIVLATGNAGKIREMTHLFEVLYPDIQVLGLKDFPDVVVAEETGLTFEENARIKALSICKATGLVAVADDSGLEVEALGGRPGVRSARFSSEGTDQANNAKLLREMDEIPDELRDAAFVCAMVACAPDGREIVAHGRWPGRIGHEPKGENGFGYDPLFVAPEQGLTSAQLDPETKNTLSHRGQALRSLLAAWPDLV